MKLFFTARPWNFTFCFAFVHVQLVLAADCAGALVHAHYLCNTYEMAVLLYLTEPYCLEVVGTPFLKLFCYRNHIVWIISDLTVLGIVW
jgi:hypothetical protein